MGARPVPTPSRALGPEDLDVARLVARARREGVFAAMARIGPACAEAVARSAGLPTEEVRRTLERLLEARVVHHDAFGDAYVLPARTAAVLGRAA